MLKKQITGLVLLMVVLLGGSLVRAELPSAETVWMYLPVDGATDLALPTESVGQINFEGESHFEKGIAGQALRVQEGDALLEIMLSQSAKAYFPAKEGSMLMWIKPQDELGKSSSWLLEGSWAGFSIAIQQLRIYGYATGNSRKPAWGNLKDFAANWVGTWHQVAMTWGDGTTRMYVDGKLLGETSDCPVFKVPFRLALGYLPGVGKTPTPRGILNGYLDDVAILKIAVTEKQVADLYQLGTSESYQGLFKALGGVVKVEKKNDSEEAVSDQDSGE